MSRLKSLLWTFFLLALAPALIAQSSCPVIVEQALQTLDQICANTARNQACYGNISLQAEPQPDATDFKFSAIGDIENVTELLSLKLEPMDEEAGTWGVVMMNLQANLPDTLPGQNVTFLLFGDVELTNAVETDSELRPMQAFYLKTGIGDAPCAEAPDSGMLVQTPKGVGEVTFNVNGVDVAMGSTVLFRTSSENEMRVVTLEGSAALKVQDKVVPVIKGTAAEVPAFTEATVMFDGPADEEAGEAAAPAPGSIEAFELELEPFDEDELEGLPFGALLRDIEEEIEPLTDEEYEALMERIENDEPLCGVGGLPSCDRVIPELGGEMCVLPENAEEGDVVCEVKELYLEQGCIGKWDGDVDLPEELEDLPRCEEVYPEYYEDGTFEGDETSSDEDVSDDSSDDDENGDENHNDGESGSDNDDTGGDDDLPDSDDDGIYDRDDNCIYDHNPNQGDSNGNGVGDACDKPDEPDSDGDGVFDKDDNCAFAYNPDQADSNGNGVGDACDKPDEPDIDGDGVFDKNDNCAFAYNPDQTDSNGNGVGDACDASSDDGGDNDGGDDGGGEDGGGDDDDGGDDD